MRGGANIFTGSPPHSSQHKHMFVTAFPAQILANVSITKQTTTKKNQRQSVLNHIVHYTHCRHNHSHMQNTLSSLLFMSTTQRCMSIFISDSASWCLETALGKVNNCRFYYPIILLWSHLCSWSSWAKAFALSLIHKTDIFEMFSSAWQATKWESYLKPSFDCPCYSLFTSPTKADNHSKQSNALQGLINAPPAAFVSKLPLHGFLIDFKGNGPHHDPAEAQASDTVNPFCMLIYPSFAFE